MLGQAAQHTVDKARRAIGSIKLGQFDGFIDGNLDWGTCTLRSKFPASDAQNIAVDGRNLIERPLGGILGDDLVEGFEQGKYPKDDLAGKLSQFICSAITGAIKSTESFSTISLISTLKVTCSST